MLALAAPVALGCGGCGMGNKSPEPVGMVVAPVAADAAPAVIVRDAGGGVVVVAPAASASPSAESDAGRLCGCSLCEPVISDDTCATDGDCAPATPCHATRCVAKAKAKPRTPDTMCTMMMACNSADANKCGCLKGRCALSPRDSK